MAKFSKIQQELIKLVYMDENQFNLKKVVNLITDHLEDNPRYPYKFKYFLSLPNGRKCEDGTEIIYDYTKTVWRICMEGSRTKRFVGEYVRDTSDCYLTCCYLAVDNDHSTYDLYYIDKITPPDAGYATFHCEIKLIASSKNMDNLINHVIMFYEQDNGFFEDIVVRNYKFLQIPKELGSKLERKLKLQKIQSI